MANTDETKEPTSSISDINLEMLFNKRQHPKTETAPKMYSKKDKKFYKKRIYDLTKSLLNNELPPVIFPEVLCAFDNYVKTCIKYFKVLDTSDIIQEDYIGMDEEQDEEQDDDVNKIIENVQDNSHDKLMMRSIKITEPNALEKLVKRTITKKEVEPIIPQQKDINLKDPILKNKGIRKKKNITNKYDEEENEENEKNNKEK